MYIKNSNTEERTIVFQMFGDIMYERVCNVDHDLVD